MVKQPIDEMVDGAVAQRVAEEGIVLLKNDRNLLPLAIATPKPLRIAVIGGNADLGVYSGGGSSQVIPVGNKPSQEILVGGQVVHICGSTHTPAARQDGP